MGDDAGDPSSPQPKVFGTFPRVPIFPIALSKEESMRRKRWTDAEVEKLRSLAGKYPTEQIAQMLQHPPAAVVKMAHHLKISLGFYRHRQPAASVDLGPPAGMDLTG
jgi:hypothetical protein